MSNFSWGILGPGGIAQAFAKDLTHLEGHSIGAVGSRSLSNAQNFASTFGGPRILGRLSLTSATDSATASSGGDPKVGIHTGTAYKQSASPSLPDKSPRGAESYRQVGRQSFILPWLLVDFSWQQMSSIFP